MISNNVKASETTLQGFNRFTDKDSNVELRYDTLTVKQAADFMGKTEQFVRIGLQRGILPFGWAVMMGKQWSYFISRSKFEEFTGIRTTVKGGENYCNSQA